MRHPTPPWLSARRAQSERTILLGPSHAMPTGIAAGAGVLSRLLLAVAGIALVASLVCLIRWRGAWRWAGGLPFLVLLGWSAKIAYDLFRDATSHNLLPLGIPLIGLPSALYLWVLSRARRRALHRAGAPGADARP